MIPLIHELLFVSGGNMNNAPADRVGLYVKPETRNRLNKFKADFRFLTGDMIGQDEAINILLDHGFEQILDSRQPQRTGEKVLA